MKRKLLYIPIIFIMISFFSLQSVFANDDIDSGVGKGINWRIASDYTLILGSAGQTQSYETDGTVNPWYNYRGQVVTAKFSGNVDGKRLNILFGELDSCTSIDLSGLDTSKATHMNGMFYKCGSLTELDLSGFDTSSAENLSYLFYNCHSLTKLDLSGFDTSNVTDMSNMFSGCMSLTSLDLSSFDMSKVTDSANMLSGLNLLETIKTPKSLKIETALPFTMYDIEGNEYSCLPKNATTSITLYREKIEPPAGECTHQWGEGKITEVATCSAEGVKLYTCSKCGETKTEIIPVTDHIWDAGTVAKPAKYYSTGVLTYTCTICGSTKSIAIPALDPSRVKPAKVKLTSAKVSSRKLTVKWKRVSKNTKGYQVALKDKKTGKQKYINVKQSKKAVLSKTIKNLKKKRKYAVRVRAYNVIGDETIYGPWSKVKSGKL